MIICNSLRTFCVFFATSVKKETCPKRSNFLKKSASKVLTLPTDYAIIFFVATLYGN